jgi:prepilin peptidase CpaA
MNAHIVMISTLASILCVAVMSDLRTHRISNVLCAGAFGTGLVLQTMLFGTAGFVDGVAGAVVGLLILLPLYAIGGMGAGDVKLMAAVGTFLGLSGAPVAGIATLVIGGGLALLAAVWRQAALWMSSRRHPAVASAPPTGLLSIDLPYAIAIATGTAAAFVVHV